MTWVTQTLGQLCDAGGGEVRTGPFGSQLHESDYSSHGIPVIMPKDIVDNRIDDGSLARVSADHVERLCQHKLEVGDIVYGRRGDIGRRALIGSAENGWLCGTGCLRIRPGEGFIDSAFLFYRLGEASVMTDIRNRAIGATMPNLNTTILRDTVLTFPRLVDDQKRIAAVLKAYDDLIEVNRRRIALLEELARALFEEWFVRFRFPGHESLAIADEKTGRLPEGWRIVEIASVVAYLNRGITPKYDAQGQSLVVGQKCIRNERLSLSLARRQTKEPPADKLLRPGDILVNSTGVGTLGRTAQVERVPEGVTVDSHVTIVRPKHDIDSDFLGLSLLRKQSEFEHLGTGSTGQAELARQIIASRTLVVAPQSLQRRFGSIVRPVRSMAHHLIETSALLAEVRDLLLPRLITGDLSIAAAERAAEDIATAAELEAAE